MARYRVVEDYFRQEIFDFYKTYKSPFYSLTFDLEIGPLKTFLQQHGYSVYLNLSYFIARAMQGIEDFRYRWLDDRMVLFDQIDLGLTVPAPGKRFTFAYCDYDADLASFNAVAEPRMREAQQNFRLPQAPHQGYSYFTALPSVPFTSFTHAPLDSPTAGQAMVAFGRFFDKAGQLRVPISLQVNHAFIDGRALGELCEAAATLIASPSLAPESG